MDTPNARVDNESQSAPRLVTLDDYLGYNACPRGYIAGFPFNNPIGDLELSREILTYYPKITKSFSKITKNVNATVKWLSSTQFATTPSVIQSLPLSNTNAFWRGYDLHVHINEHDTAIFQYPYIHTIRGIWEIVLLDTKLTAPLLHQRSAILQQASYLASGFFMATGISPAVRLLQPSTSLEEVLILPPQSVETLIPLLPVLNQLPVVRPGPLCNERIMTDRKNFLYKWACPLRQANICKPYS